MLCSSRAGEILLLHWFPTAQGDFTAVALVSPYPLQMSRESVSSHACLQMGQTFSALHMPDLIAISTVLEEKMSDLSAAVVRMGRWDRHTHTQHQLALLPWLQQSRAICLH